MSRRSLSYLLVAVVLAAAGAIAATSLSGAHTPAATAAGREHPTPVGQLSPSSPISFTLELKSAPGEGTLISVEAPVPQDPRSDAKEVKSGK